MHLPPETQSHLRPWIVHRLTSAEVDGDVLADYVLELLKSDGPDDAVARNATEQLGEFLPDAAGFVGALFKEMKGGQVVGSTVQSAAGQGQEPGVEQLRPIQVVDSAAHGQGLGQGAGRKRRNEDEDMGGVEGYGGRGRGFKAARRGISRGRGGMGRGGFVQGMPPPPQQQQQQQGMPFGFDPNNPMAAMVAMQNMLQQMQQAQHGQEQGGQKRRTGKRCRDYDNKGVCVRGANCPYDHGDDFQEYNPGEGGGHGQDQGFGGRGRGRGRGRGDRGGARGGRGGRADFSSAGPNHDRSIVSVVVENIPQESFSEDAVRAFFNEFGDIEEVTLQDFKKLAIIKFADYDAAKRAYDSPKVIFDNRFVKVYWYKPDSLPTPRGQNGYSNGRGGRDGNGTRNNGDVEMGETEPAIDPEVFAQQQQAAQDRFEQQKVAKAKRDELEAQVKAQQEERAKLLARLAEKEKGKARATPLSMTDTDAPANGAPSKTDSLRAQLAALEAEAKSMGMDPHAPSADPAQHDFAPRGRGRGFVPRGRGAFRGGWRGRGGFAYGAGPGGAVKRLDNRPRVVSVVFKDGGEWSGARDEGLKQFLLFNDQIQAAKISAHPSRADAAVVAFTERYRAETFLGAVQSAGGEVPHVGKVEVGWVANADVPGDAFPGGAEDGAAGGEGNVKGTWGNGAGGAAGDETMEGVEGVRAEEPEQAVEGRGGQEVDWDVADDDSRWLVE